ncbi:hypothetical protein K3495_g7740 [Podosphaera aphanis]|nr:hypothetical protein K3495_g7740 [Podosphaera aphanis]
MHHLYFSLRRPDQSSPSHLELDDLCPQHVSAPPRDEGTASQSMPHPRLLLGGYSYGALITISLPATVQAILAPFQSAVAGSTYAEIRRQAENFAHEQSQIVKGQKMIETLRSSPRLQSLAPNQGAAKKGRLPDNQYLNSNSQSPISSELVTGHIQSSDRLVESIAHSAGADQSEVNSNTAQAIVKDYQVAYLLISPLCGIVSDLLTLWTFKTEKNHNDLTGKSKKLQTCPTLAIYGDDDVFVSTENLRSWAETLSQSRSGHDRNQFRYVEIPGASHFWREPECIESLQAEVIAFIKSLK